MAIIQKEEPRPTVLDFEDWNKLKFRTTFQGGGYICIDVGGINDWSVKPFLKMGSRFEIKNSFYAVEDADYVIDDNPKTNTAAYPNNYIYATVNNDNGAVSLKFDRAEPTWNVALGGWYNGEDRALVKFFYYYFNNTNYYNNKVILDSYNAMFMVNTKQTYANSGGLSEISIGNTDGVTNGVSWPAETSLNLKPGVYRYEAKGGDSGAGGDGGVGGDGGTNGSVTGGNASRGQTGAAGAAKNSAGTVSGIFFWHGGPIGLKVGKNGGKGGKGGKGKDYNGSGNAGYGNAGAPGGCGGGGGGGGGLDTIIGWIIAPGAPPTLGGKNNAQNQEGKQEADAGSVGIGANGSPGEGLQTDWGNYCSADYLGFGRPGTAGSVAPNTTNGYIKLWRIG